MSKEMLQPHRFIFLEHMGYGVATVGVLSFKSKSGHGMKDLSSAIEKWSNHCEEECIEIEEIDMEKVILEGVTFVDLHETEGYAKYLKKYGIKDLKTEMFDTEFGCYDMGESI